jgi:cytochrome c
MANLEFNKMAAAILTAGITFGVAGVIGRLIVHPTMPHHAAIRIGDEAPAQQAAANVDNGRQVAQRQCASCHSFNEGGRHGVGPNLWGIVGARHAAKDGFNYSAANRALADKPWGYEELNAFIAAPARAMPGTRMSYSGLANLQQRADLIAYLRSISPNAPAP